MPPVPSVGLTSYSPKERNQRFQGRVKILQKNSWIKDEKKRGWDRNLTLTQLVKPYLKLVWMYYYWFLKVTRVWTGLADREILKLLNNPSSSSDQIPWCLKLANPRANQGTNTSRGTIIQVVNKPTCHLEGKNKSEHSCHLTTIPSNCEGKHLQRQCVTFFSFFFSK